MVPFENLDTVSYSHFLETMAVSLAVCEILSVKNWRDLENWVTGCSRSLKIAPFDRPFAFLPRDAVQVRPMPSCVCVCVCVCHVRTFCQNE